MTIAAEVFTPTARVEQAFQRIEEVDRPEVWITLRRREDVLADAASVEARIAAGEHLPLAGRLVAVKDNVDVAGLPTTAACPEFAYSPGETASAVARLIEHGAVVLGKTNLDQFATGLVGTRSPYGAVRCAWDEELISGGSSSGSAVAVALGIADIGIGTDTAGSGRVPAAFHGIYGTQALARRHPSPRSSTRLHRLRRCDGICRRPRIGNRGSGNHDRPRTSGSPQPRLAFRRSSRGGAESPRRRPPNRGSRST